MDRRTLVTRLGRPEVRWPPTGPGMTREGPAPRPRGHDLSVEVAGSPRDCLLAKGTPVRMIGGLHLGSKGTVASVHGTSTAAGVAALYSLDLSDSRGVRTRVSVKHSSVGRLWIRVPAEESPGRDEP